MGYDDSRKISNVGCDKEAEGAFLIRNSWGEGWDVEGYGWLPYDYVLGGLALDLWSLLRMGGTEDFSLQ